MGVWIARERHVGGLVGARLETTYSNDGGVWGVLAGMFAFTCIRLWLGAPSKNTK